MNSPPRPEAIRGQPQATLRPIFFTTPLHNRADNRRCMKARGGCPIHISVIPVTREKKGEDKLGKAEGDAKHGNEGKEVEEESEGENKIM